MAPRLRPRPAALLPSPPVAVPSTASSSARSTPTPTPTPTPSSLPPLPASPWPPSSPWEPPSSPGTDANSPSIANGIDGADDVLDAHSTASSSEAPDDASSDHGGEYGGDEPPCHSIRFALRLPPPADVQHLELCFHPSWLSTGEGALVLHFRDGDVVEVGEPGDHDPAEVLALEYKTVDVAAAVRSQGGRQSVWRKLDTGRPWLTAALWLAGCCSIVAVCLAALGLVPWPGRGGGGEAPEFSTLPVQDTLAELAATYVDAVLPLVEPMEFTPSAPPPSSPSSPSVPPTPPTAFEPLLAVRNLRFEMGRLCSYVEDIRRPDVAELCAEYQQVGWAADSASTALDQAPFATEDGYKIRSWLYGWVSHLSALEQRMEWWRDGEAPWGTNQTAAGVVKCMLSYLDDWKAMSAKRIAQLESVEQGLREMDSREGWITEAFARATRHHETRDEWWVPNVQLRLDILRTSKVPAAARLLGETVEALASLRLVQARLAELEADLVALYAQSVPEPLDRWLNRARGWLPFGTGSRAPVVLDYIFFIQLRLREAEEAMDKRLDVAKDRRKALQRLQDEEGKMRVLEAQMLGNPQAPSQKGWWWE